MNRKFFLVSLLLVFIAAAAFAFTVPGDEYVIPSRIINNDFFLESVRLNRLAVETYDFGDYDASTGFAEESIRYTYLSDEFVAVQLITEARRLLDWADANNMAARQSYYYYEARTHYEVSVTSHANDDLDLSISSAIRSIQILTMLQSGNAVPPPPAAVQGGASPLPRQYTVRPWSVSRDCLWKIAGYSWVYGDPTKWRELYNANRSRLPNPNNPDLIHPGFVLEIPSISGEYRDGMWDQNTTYRP